MLAVLAVFCGAGAAAGADLCQGLITDRAAHPMSVLAQPAVGESVVDPEFGTTIRRITAVAPGEPNPVIKPLYSTVSAWNADESRLLLYRVGHGHQLYDGRSYRFIRSLDIAPNEPEQVYWHTSDPDLLLYPSGRRLVRYHVRTGVKEVLHDFSFCPGDVSAGPDPMFTSWDSDQIGLQCGNQVFIYRVHDDAVIGRASASVSAPQVSPSGGFGYTGGYVVDPGLHVLRQLDLANPYEHADLGRRPTGEDTYETVAFDPGPAGSGVGSLVSFRLDNGASRVIVGPATGYPYPPTGTHVSTTSYRQPGWVTLSIVGDPSGTGPLDNEIVLANTSTGRTCRLAHHRSWGRHNTTLGDSYWAEPHAVASPSGTRVVFASDWGNGPTVDTYVLELPTYHRLSLSTVADRSTYGSGTRLTLSVGISNPGVATRVALYLLVVLPDGQHVVAFAPGGSVGGTVFEPGKWPALSPQVDLTTPFEIDQALLSIGWTGKEDPGPYRFVLFAAEPGSLADGALDSWDVWAAASTTVTFAP